MKKICVITTAHPAEDNRIYHKEISTLLEKYEVIYITTGEINNLPRGLEIVNVGYFNKSFRKRVRANFKAFRAALKVDVSLYHFHDFDFIFLAVLLRILKRRPVIYDVHEDYPAVVKSRGYVKSRAFSALLSLMVRVAESFCCLFFSGALVVNDSIKHRISKQIGKTYLLPNYPIAREFTGFRANLSENILVHLGNLNKVRGAEVIFEALSMGKGDYTLKVVGDIKPEDYKKYLVEKFPKVKFETTGYLLYEKALKMAATGGVGVIGYLPVPNHLEASPNKIFEYMALGLPVISSDLPALKRVIGDAGLLYESEVPKSLAAALKKMMNNSLRQEFSKNGLSDFEARYNWGKISKNLMELYEKAVG